MTFEKGKRTVFGFASRHPIVILSGPRGGGKTRLARLCFPQKSFIDLEDPKVLALAGRSPKTFLMAFPQGAIINSFDLVPGMLEAVRFTVDRMGFEPGRFILISERAVPTDDIGGRLAYYNRCGLTVEELESENIQTYNPFQVMQKGQLPALQEGLSAQNVIENLIQKDISRHINTCNLEAFREFLRQCALSSAEPLSMNRMAKGCGISAPTAKTWTAILERYGVVRTVRGEKDSAKLFVSDSGILCHMLGIDSPEALVLSPYREQVVRTFALNELMRGRAFKGLEPNISLGRICDFKVRWRHPCRLVVEPNIEVTDVARQTMNALRKPGKTLVLYLGDVTYSIGSTDCIGFRDWSRLSEELDYFS